MISLVQKFLNSFRNLKFQYSFSAQAVNIKRIIVFAIASRYDSNFALKRPNDSGLILNYEIDLMHLYLAPEKVCTIVD